MIKFSSLISLLVLLLISCNDKVKEPEKTEYEIRAEKQLIIDSINTNEGYKITKKFDALGNHDSTIKFTYQIQEKVQIEKKLLSFVGYIKDIVAKDSIYILKIYGVFGDNECFAEVNVSPSRFQELNKQLSSEPLYSEGCFVFKPTSIQSSSTLKVEADVTTDNTAETVEDANANASPELTFNFHRVLLFLKGDLVDFYIFNTLKSD